MYKLFTNKFISTLHNLIQRINVLRIMGEKNKLIWFTFSNLSLSISFINNAFPIFKESLTFIYHMYLTKNPMYTIHFGNLPTSKSEELDYIHTAAHCIKKSNILKAELKGIVESVVQLHFIIELIHT